MHLPALLLLGLVAAILTAFGSKAAAASPETAQPEPLKTSTPPAGAIVRTSVSSQDYVVIGWNDLGMHCMGPDFSVLVILPPANNLWAQVIKRGDPPTVVANDPAVELTYRFPDNTTSSNKVNFWTYAKTAFGVTLANDVGLAGKGLTGTMDWNGTAYEAQFVPLTPFDDATPTTLQPYQLAEVTLRLKATGQILDKTVFVAPVSTEMRCDKCHRHGGTNVQVFNDILAKHDDEEGTHLSTGVKPVLCASCHADNALGAPGVAGTLNLSRAIHTFHSNSGEVGAIDCYDCHPGPTTRCLRDAMFQRGFTCTDCHGTMKALAQGLAVGRQPWLQEPKCATCHPTHSEDSDGTNNLFRQSFGHGGLYCTACHNSPHAVLPTVQPRDGLQAIRLQGTATVLSDCSICHTKTPTGAGPHGLTIFNSATPEAWTKLH